jgi:hypothetical protein
MVRVPEVLAATGRRLSRLRGFFGSVFSRIRQRRLLCETLEPRQLLAVVVESLTPTPSGFVAQFSEAIDTGNLNLYDAQNGALGPADVTLTGGTVGDIAGSIVVDGDKLTFIATGGPLAADTYTATLRSAADAITDQALGELLDGEYSDTFPSGDGSAGGDFVYTFFAEVPQPLVVGLPDFARGPTQEARGPAAGSGLDLPGGLPIQLSDADGVTSFELTLSYDPELLEITGVQLGPDAPDGSEVEGNFTIPGEVTVAFITNGVLSGGAADIVSLTATVPEHATYGAAHVLEITHLEVNAGALQATGDDALHVVAFPGDANANRRHDTEDARLVARVGVGLDAGLAVDPPTPPVPGQFQQLFPMIDSMIIGDVTGAGGLSPLDVSDILRRVVDLSTPNLPSIPAEQAPTSLTLSPTDVDENEPTETVVGTFAVTDPDLGDTHTFSLVGGDGATDNASFTIDGDELKTFGVFDHETQDSYSIRARVTDSAGKFLERVFTITAGDVNESPTAVALSNTIVEEDDPIDTVVGDLTTTDPDDGDTHTYSLVSGEGDTDNGAFTIDGSQLETNQVFEFLTQDTYRIRVRSTDQAGLSFEQVITITVQEPNQAPQSIALLPGAVNENQPVDTLVGKLNTNDPNAGDTHTYALVPGEGDSGNAAFLIDNNELLSREVFNFEDLSTYEVRIRTTDAEGLFTDQIFTIVIGDENDEPTDLSLSNSSVPEGEPIRTVVGLLDTTDQDAGDTHTYTLVAGDGATDNASFTIDENRLETADVLNQTTPNSYTIRVRSTDSGGLFFEKALTITVTEANVAPTAIGLSANTVAENEPADTVVGTLSTTDANATDTHSYSLVTGSGDTDNASFTIDGNELRTSEEFDKETQDTYSIRVRTTDPWGLSTEQEFTVTVTNVNETPTDLALSNSSVDENQPAVTVVGSLSTTDPDVGDTHTYSLAVGIGDDDNAAFTIDGSDLKTAESFDFESQGTYSVRIRSEDLGGESFEKVLVIAVGDVNEPPTELTLDNNTVPDGEPADTVVGVLSTTDPDDGDTHSYSLVAGEGDTDNASFAIDGNQLKTDEVFNQTTKDTYRIRVRTTDFDGQFFDQMFVITVTPANAAPTAIDLSNDNVDENAAAGAVVGLLATTDPNAGDTHTYSLVAGTGADDNAAFSIDGNQLKTAATFDHETQVTYSIRVRSADPYDLSTEEVFAITVNDVNELPTDLTLGNDSVPENEAPGTVVGQLGTTDPDDGDTHTYSLVSGEGSADNALFTIDGDELKTAATFDFESQEAYSVRVATEDQDGLSIERVFTISVGPVNEAPTDLALDDNSVPENEPAETVVGLLSTTDPDLGDVHVYSLVAGAGDTDNASFTIDGNELKTAEVFDHETRDTYTVRVASEDQGGLSFERSLTITVSDANDAPTDVNLDNTSIAEGRPIGTVVGTLSSVDPNDGDTHTYSLVSGVGDTDNGAFTIDGNQLKTNQVLDSQTGTYSIRVRTTDQGGLSAEQAFTITIDQQQDPPQLDAELPDVTISMDGDPQHAAIDLTQYFSDPDGDALTFSAESDNEALVTVRVVGNNLLTTYQPYLAGQDRTPANITVTATSVDGQIGDTFTFTVQPTITAEMALVIVADPTLAGTPEAPGPARGTPTLPTGITEALVGDIYHLEIWMIDRMVGLSSRTTEIDNVDLPYNTGGLTGSRVNIEFAQQFAQVVGVPDSTTTSTNHAGWFNFISDPQAGDPPLVDNVNGLVNGFNGGNASTAGLGITPDWVRLGYIDFQAAAGTDGNSIDFVIDLEQLSRQAQVPAVLGLIDDSQITITNASIQHIEAQQFEVTSSDLTVTGKIQDTNDDWHDFTPQGTGANTPGMTGTITAVLDDLNNPTTIQLAGANLALTDTGSWEPAVDGATGSDIANLGLFAEDIIFIGNTLNFAGRDLVATVSTDGPLVIDGGDEFSSALQNWQWRSGTYDARALASTIPSTDATDDVLADDSSAPSSLTGSNGNFELTLPISRTLTFQIGAGGEYNVELFFTGDVTATYSDGANLMAATGTDTSESAHNGTPLPASLTGSGAPMEVTGDAPVEDLFHSVVATWTQALGLTDPVEIELVVADLGHNQLGEADILEVSDSGVPVRGVVIIDDDANGRGWYSSLDGDVPADLFDLQTVFAHEIGHVLGFSTAYEGYATSVQAGANGAPIFVSPDFTAELDAGAQHLSSDAHPDDLMTSDLASGQAREISHLDVAIIQASYSALDRALAAYDRDENWGELLDQMALDEPGNAQFRSAVDEIVAGWDSSPT